MEGSRTSVLNAALMVSSESVSQRTLDGHHGTASVLTEVLDKYPFKAVLVGVRTSPSQTHADDLIHPAGKRSDSLARFSGVVI